MSDTLPIPGPYARRDIIACVLPIDATGKPAAPVYGKAVKLREIVLPSRTKGE